jgi:hypothetical protein
MTENGNSTLSNADKISIEPLDVDRTKDKETISVNELDGFIYELPFTKSNKT